MNTLKSIFSPVWEWWKRVGKVIGDFIARVILTAFYFTIFVPFALITILFQDPLGLKTKTEGSHWQESDIDVSTEAQARQQY